DQYPKDSPFNLVAYSYSDYAGASLDRKSTIGGCQFLGSMDSKSIARQWGEKSGMKLLEWNLHVTNVSSASQTPHLKCKELASPKQTALGKDKSNPFMAGEDVIRSDLRLDDTDGVECLPNKEIFTELTRIGVETPLFASMLVQPQPQDEEEEEEEVEEDEIPNAPTPPSPIVGPSPPPQDLTLKPHTTPPASPPQEQPTTTTESSMSLLTTLMETCATLSKKVAELEQDKHTQALEILKLKKG
nr:copia protein [Tanacetum cinerariifolium]